MGKLSKSLVLLFSMLVFHANGNRMQLENIDDTLQTDGPKKVEKWYHDLRDKVLITSTLNFFFHANGTGSDPNQVLVAQNYIPTVTSWFGMVQVLDYPLTATDDINSEFWGYGQGFFVESSKEEFSVFMAMNLLLTKFSNSTITLLGQDSFNDKYRELSVVGGTGYFRLATGTATMYSHYHVSGIAIVEVTVFVRHYVDPLSYEGIA